MSEAIMQQVTSGIATPPWSVNGTFLIPGTMDTGVTGLRVQLAEGTTPLNDPCATFTNGETEDYLIRIYYSPCDGGANAGTAYVSDTTACYGYAVQLSDTTYEKQRSNLQLAWEQSTDGIHWSTVSGSQDKDIIQPVISAATYFRMRLVCPTPVRRDTTYSNVVHVTTSPPISCYCVSQATGTTGDSSDIGEFKILNLKTDVGGPHLQNPESYRLGTDYTPAAPPELWIDSTYTFSVYHIMRSVAHADAKVTLFIDFDADKVYEANELVYTGYTGASNYVLVDSFRVPPIAVPNVPTGMRVILNNNTGPNVPSDSACGLYTSGETEDYMVIIRSALLGVQELKEGIRQVVVFPNPAKNHFTINYRTGGGAVSKVTLRVTDMTGVVVSENTYGTRSGNTVFSETIDMSNKARGIYFVELRTDDQRIVRKLVIQ
jgi:hypothetical protein